MLKAGNIPHAISAYSETLGLAPNHLGAHIGLAKAFFHHGNLAKALDLARKAIQLDPASKDAVHF